MFKKTTIRKYANRVYLTIAMILLLTISRLAYAEDEKPVGPFAVTYNGNTWKSYTDTDKISFLQGFYQGAFYGVANYKDKPKVDERQLFLDTMNVYAYPDDGDLKTTSTAIDKFYSDENNLVIPIHEALVFIAKEKSNENMIEGQRAEWLKKARERWGTK